MLLQATKQQKKNPTIVFGQEAPSLRKTFYTKLLPLFRSTRPQGKRLSEKTRHLNCTHLLSSFRTSRGYRCRPFFPPVLAFNFYRA